MQKIWKDDKSSHDKSSIDASKAVAIARKFLEQYHSPVIFKSSQVDGKTWIVSMEVGLLKEEIINVIIDTETGKILRYSHQ